MPHSRSDIDGLLIRAYFASLTYEHEGELISDLLSFNHRPDGMFYLSSRKSPSVFPGLEQATKASVVIYKEEESIDDIAILRMQGDLTQIEDLDSSEARDAVKILADKTPLAKLILENEFRGRHVLLKYEPSVMIYNTHGEIRQGHGPTILQID
jgi:hypothetical protein